jgi:hypothetical protein
VESGEGKCSENRNTSTRVFAAEAELRDPFVGLKRAPSLGAPLMMHQTSTTLTNLYPSIGKQAECHYRIRSTSPLSLRWYT